MHTTHRQAVSVVDLVHDPDMIGVLGVVHGRGNPLVGHKGRTRLEDLEDLPVHVLQLHIDGKGNQSYRV